MFISSPCVSRRGKASFVPGAVCSLFFHAGLLATLWFIPLPDPAPAPFVTTITPAQPVSVFVAPILPSPAAADPLVILKSAEPPRAEPLPPEPVVADLAEEPATDADATTALADLPAHDTPIAPDAPARAGDTIDLEWLGPDTAAGDWARLARRSGISAGGDGPGAGGGGDGTGAGGVIGGGGTGNGGRGSGGSGGPGESGAQIGAAPAAPLHGAGNGRGARVTRQTRGEYPRAARAAGLEGVVAVAVEVLSNGRVGQVRVQQSSGAAELDAAALRAAREWRFSPAAEASGPVASWVTVRFRYRLTDN